MENESIKTATGKTFACVSLSTLSTLPRAYVRIKGASVREVAAVFSDPKETAMLRYGGECLTRYTKLMSIIPENGCIRITLGKE